MKNKLNLLELKVQSFVTTVNEIEQCQMKGGELTGTETYRCPTLPENACLATNANINCNVTHNCFTNNLTNNCG